MALFDGLRDFFMGGNNGYVGWHAPQDVTQQQTAQMPAPTARVTPISEMNALQKFGLILQNTADPSTLGKYQQSVIQDQERIKQEQNRQALQQYAQSGNVPESMRAIFQAAPELLPQWALQQNDPLRRIQMAQAQAGLENAKTERERQSALAQLFGSGGQVQQQMPEGVYGPAAAPTKLSQQQMIMRAAQIDPERYGATALESMNPQKAGGLIELSKGASLYNPTTGQFISAPTKAVSGAIEPHDAPKFEMDLRKEFDALNKDFRDVEGSYVRIQKAAEMPTAAGDIAMVFNYMKMLDPGSVVREGEFATAQNAAGVPDIVRNMYNRAMQGTRLNPEQRKDFLNTANSIYGGMSGRMKESADYYRGLAQEYGLNPDRIVKLKDETQNQPTKSNRIKFDAQGNIIQ